MSYSDNESLEDAAIYRQEGELLSQAKGLSKLETQLYVLINAIPEELLQFKDKYHKYQYHTILGNKKQAKEVFTSYIDDLFENKSYLQLLEVINSQESYGTINNWANWHNDYEMQTKHAAFEIVKEYLSQRKYDKARDLTGSCIYNPVKYELKEILEKQIATKPEDKKIIKSNFERYFEKDFDTRK